jgi:tRNA threonylcarbamoyladenosine biosynthesis protein TsaE
MPEPSLALTSDSPERTGAIAAALAPLLAPGDVLLLDGDLAAGKTLVVAALVRALGASEQVTSPTFAIAQFYAGARCPILHMDAYRLEGLAEFRNLALDEHFETSIVAIEWGSRVAAAIPQHLHIAITMEADARTLTFTPVGARWIAAFPYIRRALESA